MKLAVLAPIDSSLYSCLVTTLALQENDIKLAAVIVRSPFSLRRFRAEFRRDGARLVRKVFDKLLLPRSSEPSRGDLAPRSVLPARSLRRLCRLYGIPYLVTPDHNSPKAQALLEQTSPDLIAFTGGGLMRAEVLGIPRLGVLNCHSGILPAYRGMDVVEWPLAEGNPDMVGLTLHFMDRGIDTGSILLNRHVVLNPGESFAELRARMEPQMSEVMLEGLRGLRDGKLKPQPQSTEEGRQYFVMHPRIKAYAESRLKLIK